MTLTGTVPLLDRTRQASGRRFLPTDAHLLALARRHGARLATIDRGVGTLGGGEDLVLIPVA